MKNTTLLSVAIALGFSHAASAQVVMGDSAVHNQWFTGTLKAPSPALPQAGILAVEPYVIFTNTYGSYNSQGNYHASPDVDTLTTVIALKYGLTDRITIQALPSISHLANSRSRFTGLGDLPIEVEYRFHDENRKTGFPSATAAVGLNLPTGKYDNLRTSLSGFGSGAYSIKEQILLQSLFDTSGGHPMRFRLYAAAYQPIGKAAVNNVSIYGTNQGFIGRLSPGPSVAMGLGGGYAFSQRWVIAFDLVYQSRRGFRIDGTDALDGAIHSRSGRISTTSLAPAIEYNISGNLGIIAGIDFSLAGRNSSAYVAPQIAISAGF